MATMRDTPLKERKLKEAEREAAILHALTSRNKLLEVSKRDKKQRKRGLGQLRAMLTLSGIEGRALRDASTYVPRSYNLDKQLVGMLNHMFVVYPVPGFLYSCCMESDDRLK